MHIVTWTYEVMEGKSRADLMTVVNATSRRCAGAPGLVRRYAALGPDLKSVIEFYVWRSKAAADAYYDLDWDGETSRAWEAARMTRQDFDVVNVVEAANAAQEA